MFSRHASLLTALLLAALPCALSAQARDAARGLLTDRSAYILLPAELVAPPTVTDRVVSSDGRFVLAARTSIKATPRAK